MIKFPVNHLKHIYTEAIYSVPSGVPSNVISSIPAHTIDNVEVIGGNTNGILIINDHHQAGVIGDEEVQFLTKILHSVQRNIHDCAIITWKDDYKPVEILESLKPTYVIYFAATPQPIFKAPIEKYKIFQVNKLYFICVDALKQIEKNKGNKSLLWQNLQTLFPNSTPLA